ncbi:DUF2357 domain-containing protein [Vibrio metoecus]|uniref:DUF2357 domain-containing protein n=1 Tax=Vibrio metoecus TaxID=1481663 RepID=UPI0012ADE142|nr:DUF2357 domain-containing protein [Vibrio metoecus]
MANTQGETICYQHDDFEIFITADNLASPRAKLDRTYAQRELLTPQSKVLLGENPFTLEKGEPLEKPFFFENKPYWFEIEFKDEVDRGSPKICHKYRLLEESFSLSHRRNALQAMLNFGNDVGDCQLVIEYLRQGVRCCVELKFTVFATKMVVDTDLSMMSRQVDALYPFWRYAIAGKTSQQHAKSNESRDRFELFWLAQFERLFDEFNLGIKRILNAPHNRLQSSTRALKLDRVHKLLSAKQQERAQELIKAKRINSRLPVTIKQLSVNTPENRFIKHVLVQSKQGLSKFKYHLDQDEQNSLSSSFQKQISDWYHSVSQALKYPLWREVGELAGGVSESKVIQQGHGYAKVYKVWQQLKHYLHQVEGGDAQLAVKSVADVYEVWCFTEVISIVKSLGFEEVQRNIGELGRCWSSRKAANNEMASAFLFKRKSDGMELDVAHEPAFTPKGEENRTWLGKHKPDIVIRAKLANGEAFLLLFDAKYRIDTQLFKGGDAVPEDAINQMHRYRDAIIHLENMDYEAPLKSRPVKGAFALYPGYFPEQNSAENPYAEAIKEIGIGAFALLPNDEKTLHNVWLKQYLIEALGCGDLTQYLGSYPADYFYIEDSARIAPYGVKTVRHHGLTMITPINELGRETTYLENARQGLLKGYHTQLFATNRQNIHRNIIREVRYVVALVRDSLSDTQQVGRYLYRVRSVKLQPRSSIENDFTGKASNETAYYWLFEFYSDAIKLHTEIHKPYEEHFNFKLMKAEDLERIQDWQDISGELQVYAELNKTW